MVPLNEEQLALRNVVQEGVRDIMDTRQKDPNLYNRVVPHRIALGMDVRTTVSFPVDPWLALLTFKDHASQHPQSH